MGYGLAHQNAPVSQPWAAGREVGAESPAKKTKVEPYEGIAAQTNFLAGQTGLTTNTNGATLSHSTIAGMELGPVEPR